MKRNKKVSLNDIYRQLKGRERPRSTTFQDDFTKSEMRRNRRANDRDLIDDELQDLEYLEYWENFEDNF